MWELIALNKRKSFFILLLMFVIMAIVGYTIGIGVEYYYGLNNPALSKSIDLTKNEHLLSRGHLPYGVIGVCVSLIIWSILSIVSYFWGDRIILNVSRAVEVTPEFYPRLYNVVEEMKIAANMNYMPEVYVVDSNSMNAFATGIRPERSAICVTSGLLENLDRDELQGVIAHEMSHILNRDVMYMTFAGVMLGVVSLLSNFYLRAIFFSRGNSRSRGSGKGNYLILILSVLIAILAPFLVRIFYFSFSRKREFLADASAVRLTRYPEGLASALEKIAASYVPIAGASKVTAPMYIINPIKMEASSMYATHPPVHVRIKILRSVTKGINYNDYLRAYRNVTGKYSASLIPESGLKERLADSIRKPSAKDLSSDKKRRHRDINDLIMAANGLLFIPCTCGLTIKLAPDFRDNHINCPRCATHLSLPGRENSSTAFETAEAGDNVLSYKRKGKKWESFSCQCGYMIQISPLFKSNFIKCTKCQKRIKIT